MYQSEFFVSTDKNKLNINLIFEFLSYDAYWSKGRSRNIVS